MIKYTLLNLRSILELNCLLDKTWFWFSEETELIKQSWSICLEDVRVCSFWISGFLDCLNIRRVDNLPWLYYIFADLTLTPSFERGNDKCCVWCPCSLKLVFPSECDCRGLLGGILGGVLFLLCSTIIFFS